MSTLSIILFCIFIAWLFTSMRDKIVSTRKLKKIFQKDQGQAQIEKYDAQLDETDTEIVQVQKQLAQISQMLPNHKNKRLQKKLEKQYFDLMNKKENLNIVRQQFLLLVEDYHKNKGMIPDNEMQEHLRNYLNNRKRF